MAESEHTAENDAPVEMLRRAAALMRERAEDALLAGGEGAWEFTGIGWCDPHNTVYTVANPDGVIAEALTEEEAEHIASWRPAVALAVADWLEKNARDVYCASPGESESAIAVARAYLGGGVS